MTRYLIHACGLALALGALAISPLLALADPIPPYRSYGPDQPALTAGIVQEYPEEFLDRPAATVVIPNRDDGLECRRRYRDEPRLDGKVWREHCAQLAGSGQSEIERIAGDRQLTWDLVRYLEANIWELDAGSQVAGDEPGYWYPRGDVAAVPDRAG